jgi:hypothetical protein
MEVHYNISNLFCVIGHLAHNFTSRFFKINFNIPLLPIYLPGLLSTSTVYGPDDHGNEVRLRAGAVICFFFTESRPALGYTQPLIQRVPEALSPWVKRPGLKANYSPPISVEVKNGGALPPLPHMSSWRGT